MRLLPHESVEVTHFWVVLYTNIKLCLTWSQYSKTNVSLFSLCITSCNLSTKLIVSSFSAVHFFWYDVLSPIVIDLTCVQTPNPFPKKEVSWENLTKDQGINFSFVDYFIISHYLQSWFCFGIVSREVSWCWSPLGLLTWSLHCKFLFFSHLPWLVLSQEELISLVLLLMISNWGMHI